MNKNFEMTLTDLEATTVGEVFRHQPCTAHFIRTCFRDSLVKQFSSSAGSIYPMMKRLEKRGILESKSQKEGLRRVRYYRVTDVGQSSLRSWLEPQFPDTDLLTVDPIRTRMLYLGRIPKSGREKWFAALERELKSKLDEVRKQLSVIDSTHSDCIYQELAVENAIADLKSRLKWLSMAKSRLRANGLV